MGIVSFILVTLMFDSTVILKGIISCQWLSSCWGLNSTLVNWLLGVTKLFKSKPNNVQEDLCTIYQPPEFTPRRLNNSWRLTLSCWFCLRGLPLFQRWTLFLSLTSVFQAVKRRTSDSELTSVPQLSAVTKQVVSSDPLSISCTCQTDQRDVSTIIQLTNSLL